MRLRRSPQWALGIVMMASQAAACGPVPTNTPSAIQPYRLEAIEGSDLKRVILTAEAADRIGIRTSAVREVELARKRTLGAEVVSVDAGALLFVKATPSDLTRIDRRQAALVRPIVRSGSGTVGTAVLPASGSMTILTARSAEAPAGVAPGAALYYVVDGRAHGLARGQRVLLELPLLGGTALRKVVLYSAVLYDLSGATWTYTQADALTFVRQRVSVDYIAGELAVLSEGPAAGTEVVIVGATELFGTELRVGK